MRDLAAELRGTAARERRHGRNDVPQLCEDAADELAALRADRDELQCAVTRRDIAISGLENQVKSLRARVAELEADAARYRWLRGKVCIIGTPHLSYQKAIFEFVNLPYPPRVAHDPSAELDAAIDAARLSDSAPEERK